MNALKNLVREFWSQNPCGTTTSDQPQYSKEYYDQIEKYRYENEPQILSFAQFDQAKGKKVLEVGVGLGTDFTNWVRAGAEATGIDLTDVGIKHVQNRLGLYGLRAKELKVADCEDLPYPDNSFDWVYSWGVIMHTPNTEKALSEIIRVIKPGGTGKLMVYNRHSLGAFYLWLKHALLKGRPWKSFSWCLFHFQESTGTKGYTVSEINHMLTRANLRNIQIKTQMTYCDTLSHSQKGLVRLVGKIFSSLFGSEKRGWFLTFQFTK